MYSCTLDPIRNHQPRSNDDADVRFGRDALGRVIREEVNGVQVTSRFGPEGARSLVESTLGARQAVISDALGGPAALHHGRRSVFSDEPTQLFERDPLGLESARVLPGGVRVEWRRDETGRPVGRRTFRQQPGARPLELNALSYQWRGEDQIAALIDAARGPRFFDHDERGRLVRERRPGDSPVLGEQVLHRAMDAVGNIFHRSDLSDRRYGAGGRLEEADGVRYEHDEDGNLTATFELGSL